jgi:hypothetical protein
MRGCFFVLLLGAALLAGIAWFGAPPIANAAIEAALRGTGWKAQETTVTATADPPARLLLGHADRLSITGRGVAWHGLHADRLALTLADVDLIGRTAGTIQGSIDGAELDSGTGPPAMSASVRLAGPADAAVAAITVPEEAVRASILAALKDTNTAITDVRLVSPDKVRLVSPLGSIDARLLIQDDHDLGIATPLGTVTVVGIDPSLPLRLDDVSVSEGALRLHGLLDVETLLRG